MNSSTTMTGGAGIGLGWYRIEVAERDGGTAAAMAAAAIGIKRDA
jgi:hypothetical protein